MPSGLVPRMKNWNNARYDEIKSLIKSSVGKKIYIESYKRFSKSSLSKERETYTGRITEAYEKFFIVRRPSGVETSFTYTDVLTAGGRSVKDVFEIL